MNNKIAGRKVAMFRCHYDPMIGPKPRNAFVPDDMNAQAYINDEANGIIIHLNDGTDHMVWNTNIQSCRLFSEDTFKKVKPKDA